jgi:hypothetical protein
MVLVCSYASCLRLRGECDICLGMQVRTRKNTALKVAQKVLDNLITWEYT